MQVVALEPHTEVLRCHNWLGTAQRLQVSIAMQPPTAAARLTGVRSKPPKRAQQLARQAWKSSSALRAWHIMRALILTPKKQTRRCLGRQAGTH